VLFLPEVTLAQNVFCFTTSVCGGVSDGAYKSFNLAMHVGDNKLRVATNRQLLNAIIKQQVVNRMSPNEIQALAPIKWLNQQHSSVVVDYFEVGMAGKEANNESNGNVCDGIYTNVTNTPLAVMTADCLPVVFACNETGQVAAIHAGWRGLLNGILRDAVATFSNTQTLNVWIGPSISKAHFQISHDIVEQFTDFKDALTSDNETEKYLVDLAAIAQKQLEDLGVLAIQKSPICTYSNDNCFSHRRATHQGLLQTGRMATVVLRV
jgi:YfiH family protein